MKLYVSYFHYIIIQSIPIQERKSLSHFEITSIKLILANADFLDPYCMQQLNVWKKIRFWGSLIITY
jgi:hypothetical protein